MELVEVGVWIEGLQDMGQTRTDAIAGFASDVGVSVPTVYRWIKGGDHFVADEDYPGSISVFKLTACKEKDMAGWETIKEQGK